MRRFIFLGVVAVVSAVAAPAQAAFPGNDGKIAFAAYDSFISGSSIYTVSPDGTGLTELTTNTSEDYGPVWSPSGDKIAFSSFRDGNLEIYVMNADGSAQTRLTNTPAHEGAGAWSPDGTKIAFTRGGSIYVMNADGTGESFLTTGQGPAWSPDGRHIAFTAVRPGGTYSEIFLVDRDGTNRTQVTPSEPPQPPVVYPSFAPDCTPDGRRIAFVLSLEAPSEEDMRSIRLIRPDGTGETTVVGPDTWTPDLAVSPQGTRIAWGGSLVVVGIDGSNLQGSNIGDGNISALDWQPLPVNTPSTYVRPKAASPAFVPLVPAYATCTAPNRVHAAPLSFGSCSPPDHLSPTLTVGVGDGSPAFSRSVGSVRLAALPGIPEESTTPICGSGSRSPT